MLYVTCYMNITGNFNKLFLSCKCVCIEPLTATATAKKAAGKYGLAYFAVAQESFLLRFLCECACECYVVYLRERICSGFARQTNNKSYSYLSVLLYGFLFSCVVFLLNTFVMHFSALETEFSQREMRERKNTHKRKK